MDKRVLISTVDCWNDKIGANTFSRLLERYDTSLVANLYIREEIPNSSTCRRYFKISESSVVRSVFHRGIKTGKLLSGSDLAPDLEDAANLAKTKARYSHYGGRRSVIMLMAREMAWRLGRWKTRELDGFLDDFSPEVIMFPLEGYMHFNRINRYMARRTRAKVIGYFWDDNFTYNLPSKSFGHRMLRFFQRRSVKKTVKCCDAFFAISPKMKRECDAVFGIESVVLTKPIDLGHGQWTPYTPQHPIRMLYAGNLAIGRMNTLQILAQAISKINRQGDRLVLDVYTKTEISAHQAAALGSFVHVHEAVSEEAVLDLQQQADILLFVEDILGEGRKKARLSFSTKLTDYFKAGKCIFAIGCADIAPMEYLMENDAACCATSQEELDAKLSALVDDLDMICAYGEKAFALGSKNHSREKIQQTFYHTISSLFEKDVAYVAESCADQ